MRTFYQVVLGIEEFDLRTIRWAEIVSRISAAPIERLNQSLDMDVPQQLSRSMIASRFLFSKNKCFELTSVKNCRKRKLVS